MSEYKKEIGVAGAIAVIVALGVGLFAFAAFPLGSGTTSSASGTTTVSSTTSIASRTLPCGSPEVYCGRINITTASLTVNGSNSVLEVTIAEVGNMHIGSATVSVNGTVIGVPPASPAFEYGPPGNIPLNVTTGQQAVLVLTIPNSTIPVHIGMTYSVLVYGWLGPPGQPANDGDPASINVKAG
jgi:hypothetical protein